MQSSASNSSNPCCGPHRNLSKPFNLPEPQVVQPQSGNATYIIHMKDSFVPGTVPGCTARTHSIPTAALPRQGLCDGLKQGCKLFSTPAIKRWSLISVPFIGTSPPD